MYLINRLVNARLINKFFSKVFEKLLLFKLFP